MIRQYNYQLYVSMLFYHGQKYQPDMKAHFYVSYPLEHPPIDRQPQQSVNTQVKSR